MATKLKRWDAESAKREAERYSGRSEFEKFAPGAYRFAIRHGLLDSVCAHMEGPNKPWTHDALVIEGLKYTTRKEFYRSNAGAYNAARNFGIVDEVCSHMRRLGSKQHRLIYVYEFDDKSAYVGLTFDINKRTRGHKESGTVANKLRSGIPYRLITDGELHDKEMAGQIEADTIARYRAEGWSVINRAPAGSLGGNSVKWTRENCAGAAATCKTRSEFESKFPGAYDAVLSNRWNDVMPEPVRKLNGFWTREECAKAAGLYPSRSALSRGQPGAYYAILKHEWHDLLPARMKRA